MQEQQAMEFYERLTQGTEYYKEITLEHHTGAELQNVRMHPLDKQRLARAIEKLPEEMFEAVEGSDPDEAEEELEEQGESLAAVTEDTVEAFEDMVHDSLEHDNLTNTQMRRVVSELDFELLFRLGTEIINMSVEKMGDIKDFHEHD